MLEHVGLTDHASMRTDKLSGGQMQRLSIACSLVHDPEVVFLDEPTAALDPQARRNLWGLLSSLNDRGRTVVLTTHSMEEAETLCDRVAIMDHGRILAVDRPTAMVRSLHAPTRLALPDGSFAESAARAMAGVDDVTVEHGSMILSSYDPRAVLQQLAAADRLDGLTVRGANLEDVFLSLTGREYRV
jgi:ABC-2 type transport system ATP-binding protein